MIYIERHFQGAMLKSSAQEKAIQTRGASVVMSEKNIDSTISVVIPIYNQSHRIKECLTSLTQQTHNHLEIICVDDKSTDSSLEILKEFYAKDNRIKIIALPQNTGVSSARNIGIEYASGKYVCFMDSDDRIAPEGLARLFDIAQSSKADMVLGAKLTIDAVMKTEAVTYGTNEEIIVLDRQSIVLNCLQAFFENEGLDWLGRWNLQSCLFSSDFLRNNDVRFNEEQLFGEDARFMLESYSVASSAVITRIPFHIYNYDSSSVSKKYAEKFKRATIQGYQYQKKIIEQNHLPKNCMYNLIGKTFVGINAVMLRAINRKEERAVLREYINNPQIKDVIVKILFMNRKNMVYADISNKQRITALFYLLGMYKKGLSFEQSGK